MYKNRRIPIKIKFRGPPLPPKKFWFWPENGRKWSTYVICPLNLPIGEGVNCREWPIFLGWSSCSWLMDKYPLLVSPQFFPLSYIYWSTWLSFLIKSWTTSTIDGKIFLQEIKHTIKVFFKFDEIFIHKLYWIASV